MERVARGREGAPPLAKEVRVEETFAAPAACLVRAVPGSFDRALSESGEVPSVSEARRQHADYVAALRTSGARLIEVAADESCPDCCFLEDCAVVLRTGALITHPGAPSRVAETPPVAAALSAYFEIHRMVAPAVLDGGDVMRVGRRLFVGLSSRTNEAGAARLAEVAGREGLEVVRVSVPSGLHLKSLCSLAGPGLMVHAAGLDPAPFCAAGLEALAVDEPAGANVLALGKTVLVSADAPRTRAALEERGVSTRTVRVSEFHKADGALTCLSIRVPPAARWVT
jgi:dimethylargininase